MIGITGVTGKLGGHVAQILADKGITSIHLARRPERAAQLPQAEIRQAYYENSPETVATLAGIDTLLMVSAHESPERVQEHQAFLDAAKAAGVQHIVYTSFYGARPDATFTLSRDHAQTESYIKDLGFTYTFLRDNFYLDFFVEMAVDGEIRGPAGSGVVSAVARKDTSAVAAQILLEAPKWQDQTLNLTGPEELSMQDIVTRVGQKRGTVIPYIAETIEEAYQSRLKWPAEQWEYDAWVSTYTAIQAGEQAGISQDVESVLGRPATSLEELLDQEKHMSNQVANAENLYLRGIRDGQVEEVLDNYMGASYTQHSTGVPDEKEGFAAFFKDFLERNPERDIRIVRTIEDGNLVFVHVHQYLNGGQAQWVTTDTFRSDDEGRIVEHWDVIDYYTAPQGDQLDQIFGDFELKDLEKTAENKKTVRRFLTEVFQNGELASWEDYVADDLIQHNHNIEQGSLAYKNYVIEHEINYDFVFQLLAQGNYVVSYGRTVIDDQAYAQYDIFRLEAGKIVEHWDNKEVMPAKKDLTNLGKF